ncbi:hypothetical protein RHGRI_019031 [Rhododendron griersonianum]|uniref:Peroxidase n=1 Tax=Rhododendron griersonianum TaxID=479676 RepID=A0AAV6JAU9_9ERIC|nr:hypothetical protein RHGRI_019031 [Rhododendron griersonianum]
MLDFAYFFPAALGPSPIQIVPIKYHTFSTPSHNTTSIEQNPVSITPKFSTSYHPFQSQSQIFTLLIVLQSEQKVIMGCTKEMQIVLFLLLASATTLALGQGTRVGFYSGSCPRAESIVQAAVRSRFQSDPTVAPGLLRMHFHDCFVRGCDASILIDGPGTEKMAGANSRLRGIEAIDDAKKQLEAVCPGVVSCADILALATRDAVVLTSGRGWLVPTGRRDGTISLSSEASNLPGPTESVDSQKKKFAAKGLNDQDLVTLVGGHTIGTTACQFFRHRLNNFNNTNNPDPTIDPAFLPQLRSLCPENGDGSKLVGLDNGSPNTFDTSFYANLRSGRGILESDQMLWTDASTKSFVQRYLGVRGLQALNFNVEFGRAMVKMSNIEVKTGTDGEIRRVCSKIN